MIAIGSDHAGYELKEELKKYLQEKGLKTKDLGTNDLSSVDYPDFGRKVGEAVINDQLDFGIVVCGTGIGISIAANKVKGIRAALVYDEETASLAKMHNNANVIALGGRKTSIEEAKKIVDAYLSSQFEERHQKRLDKISVYEGEHHE